VEDNDAEFRGRTVVTVLFASESVAVTIFSSHVLCNYPKQYLKCYYLH